MSVDFEPVQLDARRRRIDPGVVVAVALVILLGVAVIKPWDGGGPPDSPAPSVAAVGPSVAPSSASEPGGNPPAPAPTDPPAAHAPTRADLASILTPHDVWGVQTILLASRFAVKSTVPLRYGADWSPAATDPGGFDTAAVGGDGRSIVILGVTAPRAEQPEDARIWRVHEDDQLEWVDATLSDSGDANGSFLFMRPGVNGVPFEAWDPGQYRIEVLVKGGIHRIDVGVLDETGTIPPPDEWVASQPDTVPASASDPSNVRVGLFATVDGVGVPVAAPASRSLDEDSAWVDLARTGGDIVKTAYLPRATGLGVMLTSHAFVETATINRLAPDGRFQAPPSQGGISLIEGRTPYVLFAAPGGGVWRPGIYAISVTWRDPAGTHRATWHVELRPGLDT